ncbi:hypothetical protein [Apilactobacillus kunkeei]|uniref:hypothetical protein n=1 Tax=Apilactobacillus kunkeei TaxID=148814 RepID=UPI0006B25142|nr:hypothetical protein [Apilactobacillus kunkeei]
MYWTDERIMTYRAKIKGAWYVQKFQQYYQFDLRKPEDKMRMYRQLEPKIIKSYFDDLIDTYEKQFLEQLDNMSTDDLLETLDSLRDEGYIDIM